MLTHSEVQNLFVMASLAMFIVVYIRHKHDSRRKFRQLAIMTAAIIISAGLWLAYAYTLWQTSLFDKLLTSPPFSGVGILMLVVVIPGRVWLLRHPEIDFLSKNRKNSESDALIAKCIPTFLDVTILYLGINLGIYSWRNGPPEIDWLRSLIFIGLETAVFAAFFGLLYAIAAIDNYLKKKRTPRGAQ